VLFLALAYARRCWRRFETLWRKRDGKEAQDGPGSFRRAVSAAGSWLDVLVLRTASGSGVLVAWPEAQAAPAAVLGLELNR
jgi:hypothetical protein